MSKSKARAMGGNSALLLCGNCSSVLTQGPIRMLIEPGVAVFGGTAVATLREFADSSFFRGGEKSDYNNPFTDIILGNYFTSTQDNPSSPSIFLQLSLVNLCQAWIVVYSLVIYCANLKLPSQIC